MLSTLPGRANESYLKEWSDGRLTWNDFTEIKNNSPFNSELKSFLYYEPDIQNVNGVKVERLATHAFIDKTQSWVKPEYKSDQLLKYNQILFDIVELNRRILQKELDNINYQDFAFDKYNCINQICSNQIQQFQNESQRGELKEVVDAWDIKIKEELKINSNYNLPEYKVHSIGLCSDIGIGGGIYSGSIGEHFTPTYNIVFGLGFNLKNSVLFINATFASNRVRSNYFGSENWYSGQSAKVGIYNLSYGYVLLDNKNLKLTPYAGLGFTELTGTSKDNDKVMLRAVDYNYMVGLNFDYKISKKIKLMTNSYSGIKDQVEKSVQVKLYVVKANLHENLSGHSINMSIGFSGLINFIKLNN